MQKMCWKVQRCTKEVWKFGSTAPLTSQLITAELQHFHSCLFYSADAKRPGNVVENHLLWNHHDHSEQNNSQSIQTEAPQKKRTQKCAQITLNDCYWQIHDVPHIHVFFGRIQLWWTLHLLYNLLLTPRPKPPSRPPEQRSSWLLLWRWCFCLPASLQFSSAAWPW